MNNLHRFVTLDKNSSTGLLSGYFLVASPNMDDPYFKRSVILICANDTAGSFGVVINKKQGIITSQDIYAHHPAINLKKKKSFTVNNGGPIDKDMLIVISIPQSSLEDFEHNPKFIIYSNAELFLRDALDGVVKDQFLIFNGYCSWNPKQLEGEIADGSWQLLKPSLDILFFKKPETLWNKAIKSMNLDENKVIAPYSGIA